MYSQFCIAISNYIQIKNECKLKILLLEFDYNSTYLGHSNYIIWSMDPTNILKIGLMLVIFFISSVNIAHWNIGEIFLWDQNGHKSRTP